MFYSIRHITRFRYVTPVRESVMELRMQPHSEGLQSLRTFQILTAPRAQLSAYTDHFGNAVYHFNVLRAHGELSIEAQSVLEMGRAPDLPDAVDSLEWSRYNAFNLDHEHYEFLEASRFARQSPALDAFIATHGLARPDADPLTALKRLNRAICGAFAYSPGATDVHSPIDQALAGGRGVCQDFAHIMIAVARSWGIPARYVSGYLHHRLEDHDRSSEDATHAWVEAYLPSLGWTGFDPTNDILAGERHIRVAVGRDYGDVPPTRGTFKGEAESELAVAVTVAPTSAPVRTEQFLRVTRPIVPKSAAEPAPDGLHQQQQQQQ